MFITPMTADTVNDNFAANSTNYPALKIHIPFNEITGGTFLTDSIVGMVVPVDAATSIREWRGNRYYHWTSSNNGHNACTWE